MVVCNTSPIVALARAGMLDLLHAVHGKIVVPEAVFHEITVAGAGEPGASEVAAAPWIKRRLVLNLSLVNALSLELDAGEAEAIALAVECRADLILLDERMGRHAAQRMGLTVTGTLGILIAAKDRGLLVSVRPMLDALRAEPGSGSAMLSMARYTRPSTIRWGMSHGHGHQGPACAGIRR